MDDTKKMLQAIINGQSAIKEELLNRIDKLERKVDQNHKSLSNKLTEVEDRLTERIDKIGSQVARLEDDTPTREEFDDLDKRINILEQTRVSM